MARRPAPTKAHPESKPGDDLIARLAGAPAPPILSDDELARLRAHLKTPLRLSAMKDKAERDRWRTPREVLNYNDELRADARGTPAPTPTVSVSPDLLDRLQRAAAAVDPGAIDRAAERAAEKIARVFGENGNPTTKALPARTEVVLWEGAEHNERNVRLARTRSAYLEAHGNVTNALAALKAAGNEISRSTFYNHLDALDKAIPRWRESVQLSNPTGNLDGMRIVGTRGKSRGKVR